VQRRSENSRCHIFEGGRTNVKAGAARKEVDAHQQKVLKIGGKVRRAEPGEDLIERKKGQAAPGKIHQSPEVEKRN